MSRLQRVFRVQTEFCEGGMRVEKCEIILPVATTDKADLSRIGVVPGQRSGQPCIRGLRLTVWDVLDMLACGMSEDEILQDYPYLERADFPAVYAYASQAGRERMLP
jgi:uncharacterized protein (DUF433 family)